MLHFVDNASRFCVPKPLLYSLVKRFFEAGLTTVWREKQKKRSKNDEKVVFVLDFML